MGRILPYLLVLIFIDFFAGLSFSQKNNSPASITEYCIECHPDQQDNLRNTPHQVGSVNKMSGIGAIIYCQDCHINYQKHTEDPQVGNIFSPKKGSAEENLKVCASCHFSSHIQELSSGNPHFENQVKCVDCHGVHNSKKKYLLKSSTPELCFGCHPSIKGEFDLPSRHPLMDKVIDCVDCHDVLKSFSSISSPGSADEMCLKCHSEYQSPFPYEHNAANDYTLEGQGCTYCHNAHGSTNPRLLKQPGNGLCLQCHTVPRHTTAHYGLFANRSCQDCHTDVHGSYNHKFLFGEEFLANTCFAIGCHSRD
jgi:DmsE family decaheme c-type cytochrome